MDPTTGRAALLIIQRKVVVGESSDLLLSVLEALFRMLTHFENEESQTLHNERCMF